MTTGPSDRRDPNNPLRRVKDYRPNGSRTRRWSPPERSIRLSYRRRPIVTLAGTLLAVVLPATVTVAATSLGGSDFGPKDSGEGTSITGTGRIIAITGDGFGAPVMTIAQGDTVSFINLDAVPHEVQIQPDSGSTCASTVLFVSPHVYRSCTFTSTGTFSIVDPSSTASAFRSQVTVGAESMVLNAVVLSLAPTSSGAGKVLTLRGSINISKSGVQVDLIAKDLTTGNYRKVGETRTSVSGAFTITARPANTTSYFVNAIQDITIVTSIPQTVQVTRAPKTHR